MTINFNQYTDIGKIYKNSILKNAWLAYIYNIKYLNYINSSSKIFFIEINGIITPFFIYYYKQINKNKFLLNFDDSAKAENFLNKNLYLKLNIHKIHNNNYNTYDYLIQYQAIDINKRYIGIINKIHDNLPQKLFEIIDNNNQRKILIPIVKNFINTINNFKKIIILDIPEGLINLN